MRDPVRFASEPGQPPEVATIRDLSVMGIGLLTHRSVEPGTVLQIELSRASGGTAKILSADVRYTTSQADGSWILGCGFSHMLTIDETMALG